MDEQITEFMRIASRDRYGDLLMIDLFSGLRQGEIIGLTWDCLDFSTGLLTVKHQLQREKKANGKYYLTTLKNDKTRTICLAPFVLELFQRRKEMQELEKIAAYDQWHEDIPGLIFETVTGGHLSHVTVRKHFKKVVSEMGIPEMRFHDLRHSFAVTSLQNGDDIKTVQENLGHHSAAFTLDTYCHVTDKMRQDSARRMEDYIKRLRG